MSLYESFLKEAVETTQIIKDELKNDPVNFFFCFSCFSQLIFFLVHRQTFKPAATAGAAREGGEKLSDGVWLYSYVAWIRLSKMIERNLATIDNGKQQIFKTTITTTDSDKSSETSTKKVTKAADVVRMYDLLLQVRIH